MNTVKETFSWGVWFFTAFFFIIEFPKSSTKHMIKKHTACSVTQKKPKQNKKNPQTSERTKYPNSEKNNRVHRYISWFLRGFFFFTSAHIYIAILLLKQQATQTRSQRCKPACESAQNRLQLHKHTSWLFIFFTQFWYSLWHPVSV